RNINNLNKEVTFFSDEIFYRRRHGFSNELVRRLTYVYDNGEPYLDGHTIGITDYIEINYDFDTKNSTTTKTSDMAMESVADRVRANIYVSYKMQARPIFSDMTKKDPRKMIATKLIKKYTSELELTDEFINQEKRTYTCEDSTVNYTLETLSVGDGFVYALSKKEKGKDSKPLITTPMAIQKDNLIILGSGKTKFTLILRKINNVTYVVGVTQ
ncbi:hypothetical protein KC678_02975, partial [Candidatus Dojkabacteria bacterium]|nr:hypothetical protein [Candidatus Dojkabacteria bacterium]